MQFQSKMAKPQNRVQEIWKYYGTWVLVGQWLSEAQKVPEESVAHFTFLLNVVCLVRNLNFWFRDNKSPFLFFRTPKRHNYFVIGEEVVS